MKYNKKLFMMVDVLKDCFPVKFHDSKCNAKTDISLNVLVRITNER